MILFEQRGLPVLQNKVYNDPESARLTTLGDVELVRRSDGLVHNRNFVPELLKYDQSYQNEQAHAPPFRDHLRLVADYVSPYLGKEILEIGCGKAAFLEVLRDLGNKVRGLDPAYEGADPSVERRDFDSSYDGPAFDFVVLRHVLEHVPEPWKFLGLIAGHARRGCKIYVEVPCFKWSAQHGAFFDVFYEHVNYFVEDLLCSAFSNVLDVRHLFGGQYLCLVAELTSLRTPSCEHETPSTALMSDWRRRLLLFLALQERPLFVWGAGAKGTTLTNVAWKEGLPIAALIDINPAKQGKFVGLSGVPVVAPSDVPRDCTVVVMNSMYEAMAREALPSTCDFVLAEVW